MKRTIVAVLAMVFITSYGVAALPQPRKSGKVSTTLEALVTQAHTSFMSELKFDHTNFKGGSMLRGRGMPQFFVSPSLLSRFTKEEEFLKVYNALNKNSHIEVEKLDFKIEPTKVDSVGLGQLNSDNVVIRANKYIRYITETDLHLRVANIEDNVVSDTCFGIVLTWQYNVASKKVEGITHIGVFPKKYTTAEKIRIEGEKREQQAMEENAKRSIMDWYAVFPDKVDAQYKSYIGDSVILPKVSLNNIKLSTQNDVYVTASAPKIVMIAADKEGRNFIYTIDPRFEVDKGDFKIVKVNWTPGDTTEIKRQEQYQQNCIENTSLKQELSIVAAKNFSTELIACAHHPTAAAKKLVASMFVDAKVNIVEVSYVSASISERIIRRIAYDYLERLRESTIKINIDIEHARYSEDGNFVVFPFEQIYKSNVYRDRVIKELHMRAIGDAWYVERIEVVRNSTKLE